MTQKETDMKRVLILADHSLVAHAIRSALRQSAGFDVLGFVDGRQCARECLSELKPDVVIVDDMRSPDLALQRLRDAAEKAPEADTVLLTLCMEDDRLDEAFNAGATAVISKTMH